MRYKIVVFLLCFGAAFHVGPTQVPYPGEVPPGKAECKQLSDHSAVLQNAVIGMTLSTDEKTRKVGGFEDKNTKEQLKIDGLATLFEVTLSDSSVVSSNEFTFAKAPVSVAIVPQPGAATYASRLYLKTQDWNCLARASKWARESEVVLSDVHWVGGDPIKSKSMDMQYIQICLKY